MAVERYGESLDEQDSMKDEAFENMMADLIAEEEEKLGVGSKKFIKKYSELKELLDNICKKR